MGTWAGESIQKGKGMVNLIKCADQLLYDPTQLLVWQVMLHLMDWEPYYHINWEGQATNCFASCSLAPVENYSQIDKETLAIVFGVKNFHQYLFGRKYIIKSDHKPLQHLFGEREAFQPWLLQGCSIGNSPWVLMIARYNTVWCKCLTGENFDEFDVCKVDHQNFSYQYFAFE